MASSSSELKTYESLIYPETEVLKNKLGIKNQKDLEFAEALSVETAAKKGFSNEARQLSVSGLKQAHKEMFNKVYEWAGEYRQYTTDRGVPFARPEYIDAELKKSFSEFSQSITGKVDKATFVKSTAKFIGDLNAIHPFVDGNGRTQRYLLNLVAEKADYQVDYTKLNRSTWYAAAKESHMTAEYGQFKKIINDSVQTKIPESKIKKNKVLASMISLSVDSSDTNKKWQAEQLKKSGVTQFDYQAIAKQTLTKSEKKIKKQQSNDLEI